MTHQPVDRDEALARALQRQINYEYWFQEQRAAVVSQQQYQQRHAHAQLEANGQVHQHNNNTESNHRRSQQSASPPPHPAPIPVPNPPVWTSALHWYTIYRPSNLSVGQDNRRVHAPDQKEGLPPSIPADSLSSPDRSWVHCSINPVRCWCTSCPHRIHQAAARVPVPAAGGIVWIPAPWWWRRTWDSSVMRNLRIQQCIWP